MAAKAILIVGKLCSGKSFYAKKLRREEKAAVLSCDQLLLTLFPEGLGDRHDQVSKKAQEYLFQRAAELLALSVPVILEWGFWTRKSRQEAENFFRSRGFETQWHYVRVTPEQWRKNVEKRNAAGNGDSYYVDSGLAKKCDALFEEPQPQEIDVVYDNRY